MRKSRFTEHLGPDEPPLPKFGLTESSSMFSIPSENANWPLGPKPMPSLASQPSVSTLNTISSSISQAYFFRSVPDLAAIKREQAYSDVLLRRARAAEAARPRSSRFPRGRLPCDVYASTKSKRSWLPRLRHGRDAMFWFSFLWAVISLIITIALVPAYVVSKSQNHLFFLVLALLFLLTGTFMMLLCSDWAKAAWLNSIGIWEVGELDRAIREQRAEMIQGGIEGVAI